MFSPHLHVIVNYSSYTRVAVVLHSYLFSLPGISSINLYPTFRLFRYCGHGTERFGSSGELIVRPPLEIKFKTNRQGKDGGYKIKLTSVQGWAVPLVYTTALFPSVTIAMAKTICSWAPKFGGPSKLQSVLKIWINIYWSHQLIDVTRHGCIIVYHSGHPNLYGCTIVYHSRHPD